MLEAIFASGPKVATTNRADSPPTLEAALTTHPSRLALRKDRTGHATEQSRSRVPRTKSAGWASARECTLSATAAIAGVAIDTSPAVVHCYSDAAVAARTAPEAVGKLILVGGIFCGRRTR
jgi:hypothetical protein